MKAGAGRQIPVARPAIGPTEAAAVASCVESGWISSEGEVVVSFERAWANVCGRRHGIAVSNGTTALELAIRLLGIGPGDEVIIPTFTIVSCALAVVRAGATPVLVDSDPRTYCMEPAQVETKIGDRTKALMIVHVYGHPAAVDPLLDIARRHDLAVVEDAAEAHGAEYFSEDLDTWKTCGGFGDVSCFSFYANKLVTTGEGGMVLVDDDDLADRARRLRALAPARGHRFLHDELGYNFRLSALQAAFGTAQIPRLPEIVRTKRRIASLYDDALGGSPYQRPPREPWARNVYWVYGLVVDEATGLTGADVQARLDERGVQTRPFFEGMHRQPALAPFLRPERAAYPHSDHLSKFGFYVPSGPDIADDEIEAVAAALLDVVR